MDDAAGGGDGAGDSVGGERICGQREAGARVSGREKGTRTVSDEPADFSERRENAEDGRHAEAAGTGGDAEADCQEWRARGLRRRDGTLERGCDGEVRRIGSGAGM